MVMVDAALHVCGGWQDDWAHGSKGL